MKKIKLLIVIMVLLSACSSDPERSYYILDETELVPEGIAYSAAAEKFYLTSLGKSKIISLDEKTGEQEDFISERESNFPPGAGIFVDDERSLLHAVGGYYSIEDSVTSLFTFDLNTRELLNRYDVSAEGPHFLNDLIQDNEGNIYVTDSKSAAIWLLGKGNEELELFYHSDDILYPNGIAISDDNTNLFIASSKGVRILNIGTKEIVNEEDTLGISQGIDGLELYKNNLYAVQNGVESNGYNFRMLELNEAQNKITGFRVIDEGEDLNLPLTFCIANDKAVVIGNSNLQYLDQESLSFPVGDSLKNTKLLIYDLSNRSINP